MKTIKKVTLNTIKKLKEENKKIVALTAYDYSTAKCADEAEVDFILVGDSLAMVALGYETTHCVTMEEMLHHTKAVSRGVKKAMVIADMPFLSYHGDKTTSLLNAGRFIKEANASAVKIEGAGDNIIELIKYFVESGIPVLAHIGFTPQFLHTIGGYNIQGKTFEATQKLLDDARKLEQAGAFGIVLEMVPEESSKLITENINIPTIGIGAGRFCSGQILVTDDILGKYNNFKPKFARKYLNMHDLVINALNDYKNDVLSGNFPSVEEIFNIKEEEKERIKNVK